MERRAVSLNAWNKYKCHICIVFCHEASVIDVLRRIVFFSLWGLTGTLLIMSSQCALFFCSCLMAADWRITPISFFSWCAKLLIAHITVMDKNVLSFEFSLAYICKLVKTCSAFGWKLDERCSRPLRKNCIFFWAGIIISLPSKDKSQDHIQ